MVNLLLFPHNLFSKKTIVKVLPTDLDIRTLSFTLVEDPLFFGDRARISRF